MLLTLSQTAEKLGITETSVKRLMEAGTLPNVPYGKADAKRKTLRFNEAVVRETKRALARHDITVPVSPLGHKADVPAGYVAAGEAATILGWKHQRVNDMTKSGRLTALKVGNRSYYSPEEIERAKALPKVGPVRKATVEAAPVSSNGNGPHTESAPASPSGIAAFANRLTAIDQRLNGIERDVKTIFLRLDDLVKAFS